ncbi:MAG: hypothetical protein K0U98_01060 [Deltaproteobacteria bacterium]|nr:hypothetical protein [Deltaproteobacteria bacterium]
MEAVEVKEGVVVRVETPVGHIFNRNVFLIDEHHRVRWQIQESPHGSAEDRPFMNLISKDGVLVVGNWNGVDYDVDLESGEIQACTFAR